MSISSYNVGRSVKDLPVKSWIDGTRFIYRIYFNYIFYYIFIFRLNLRPDTIYADERYVNITQPEINEAKARIAEKNKGKVINNDLIHGSHYDYIHAAKKEQKPLYP